VGPEKRKPSDARIGVPNWEYCERLVLPQGIGSSVTDFRKPGFGIAWRAVRVRGGFGLGQASFGNLLFPLGLAEFMRGWKQKTSYSEPSGWVFPSSRLKGKQPRVGNMLVEDYLRPAAAKAGILSSHRDEQGRLVEDDPRRFGFHNLRHSQASFLVRMRTDSKTVQTLLRHSDVKLTIQFYSHAQRGSHGWQLEKCSPRFSATRWVKPD
jgi:hypothetical protein